MIRMRTAIMMKMMMMMIMMMMKITYAQVPHDPTKRLQIKMGIHTGATIAGVS